MTVLEDRDRGLYDRVREAMERAEETMPSLEVQLIDEHGMTPDVEHVTVVVEPFQDDRSDDCVAQQLSSLAKPLV